MINIIMINKILIVLFLFLIIYKILIIQIQENFQIEYIRNINQDKSDKAIKKLKEKIKILNILKTK